MRRLFSFVFWIGMMGVGALKVAEWTSENWWMDALGFHAEQRAYWTWRLASFFPAFGLWGGFMGLNARLAWHNAHWRDVSLPLLGPRLGEGRSVVSPADRARLDFLARRCAIAFVLMSALLCGVAAANHFDMWVLALSGNVWGAREASGGGDIGFFVWVLPALDWAGNAFGTLFFFSLALVAAIAAFEGVLDFDTHGLHVGDATARHLAVLGALLLGWIGARSGLAMLEAPINFGWSPGGVFGFYDQNFAQPTRFAFLAGALPLAIWFARAAPHRFGRAVLVATGWSLAALFAPLLAPSFGRALWPRTPSLDASLGAGWQQHIETTRRAWDLDRVEDRALKVETSDFLPPIPSAGAQTSGNTLPVAAWPRLALRRALDAENTDSLRLPTDLFVSREGGSLVARVIEINPTVSTATSALSLATDASASGTVSARREPLAALVLAPNPTGRDAGAFAPNGFPATTGEGTTEGVRVREEKSRWGVERSNAGQGLALAARFGDRSLLVAGRPITWHLDPIERLETLAPMVFWQEARPHPVAVNVPGDREKHLLWLVEGCFVSRNFPGAAMSQTANSWSGINYARQSVLGVCDASTGETTLYAFDPDEPFTRAWQRLLPGFFRPVEELPAALRAQTRLSRPLSSAQCEIWTRYHTPRNQASESQDWANHTDDWRILWPDPTDRERPDDTVALGPDKARTLRSLCSFAPLGGTLASIPTTTKKSGESETIPLLAMLGTSDEGDELWRERGHARRTSWRAPKPLALPSEGADTDTFSPLTPEIWRKTSTWPELDARGDVVGLSLLQSTATPQKNDSGQRVWTLATRLFSTLPSRAEDRANSSPAPDLARLRTLWNAWKSARAAGRWERVETLEAELNRLLGP